MPMLIVCLLGAGSADSLSPSTQLAAMSALAYQLVTSSAIISAAWWILRTVAKFYMETVKEKFDSVDRVQSEHGREIRVLTRRVDRITDQHELFHKAELTGIEGD